MSGPGAILIGAGGCLMGLGMLVFGIWWLVLIVRYRNRFNEAARMARATWATDDTGQPTK